MGRFTDRMPLEKRGQGKLPPGRVSTGKVQTEDSFIMAAPETIVHDPDQRALSPQALLQLQRTHGNQYVCRLIQRTHTTRPIPHFRSLNPVPPVTLGGDNDVSGATVSSTDTPTVQRTWSDVPLVYSQIRSDKTSGGIRTGRAKFNSIEDWVKKFITALTKNKKDDALKALKGLMVRLKGDAVAANNGKLKPPKGTAKKDFDLGLAKQAAASFFKKWIDATQAHIDHTNTSTTWLSEFRSVYVGSVTKLIDVDSEEETSSEEVEPIKEKKEKGGKSEEILDPRSIFLDNVAQLEDISSEHLKGMAALWDLGDSSYRNRLLQVMGGDPELKRLNQVEYFLEAVTPGHIGYTTVKNMFNFWTTGVLYHSFTISYVDWISKKVSEGTTTFGTVKQIPYFNEKQRVAYELSFSGQNVLKADSKPLVGNNIYVVSGENVFYGGAAEDIHHSSFLEGMPVKCAGHLETDSSGKLLRIDNNSGHYAPEQTNLKRGVAALKEQMDTSEVVVGSFSGKGGVSVDEFLKK